MASNSNWYSNAAKAASRYAGRPATFFMALLVILAWIVTGPLFGFSDTWQLVINTGTTIITFNMVFIIQNTQNRDGRAMQAKLDAQSQALAEIMTALELSAEREKELHRLVGIEEAPERTIRTEQERIHQAS